MAIRSADGRPAKKTRQTKDSAAALFGLLSAVVRGVARDMALTSLSTLSSLDRAGPRRITELAAIQGITQPSMTVLISAMEHSGYIERHGDPADKRVTLVALTAAGSAYLKERRNVGREIIARLIKQLPPAEAATLTTAIPALTHLVDLDDQQRDPSRTKP